ncbi:MAG: TSUP family transporter [Patescibacteria group bacterium]
MFIESKDLLIYFLIFISELLGTVVVFGSSAFFLPIAIHFLSKNQSLGLLAFFQAFINPMKLFAFFKNIDWKVALIFGLPSVFMVILSSYIAQYVNAQQFRFWLGIILIILVLLEIFKNIRPPKNTFSEFFGGLISGFISGLLGTGGAIRGYFIFSFNLSKEALIGTYAFIDATGDFLRFFVYWSNGVVQSDIYKYFVGALLAAGLGNLLGVWVLKKVSINVLRPILIVTIFILSILLIFGM